MDAVLETSAHEPVGGSYSILKRYNCRVNYVTDDAQASTALAAILADAKGGLVAIDIETAPLESERQNLATLAHQEAVARGTLKALAKLRGEVAAMVKAKADLKALIAQKAYAERAGLDPDRSRIRLLQAYGGGGSVAVFDMDRISLAALAPLWEALLAAHNAAFELSFLHRLGIEPVEMHCTMQAVRLLYGPNVASLEHAAATVLGIEMDKTYQTSDWSLPSLTRAQVDYAAADAVVLWHLANRVLPRLAEREPAYEIQMTAIPAVVRMEARGFRLDAAAHASLLADLIAARDKAEAAYCDACVASGRSDLAAHGVPSTPAQKQALLAAIMSSDEVASWARTAKSGQLSTKRAELRRAAYYPPIAHLSTVAVLDKQTTSFGITLASHVSPVTGRVHAHYNVAGTNSGRASCSGPNLQQIPRDKRFRALFVAAPGNVLVAADFSSMELRAAAEISGDAAMRDAFARGDDLHRLTAARATGKRPEDVTPDERSAAKRVNFGAAYGMGSNGLVKSAWDGYGVVLTISEAEKWLTGFSSTYPTFAHWRHDHYNQCKDNRRIVIGRDAAYGFGRVFELAWLPPDRSAYTVSCNLPIQGACADASMLALAAIDEALYAAGIDGGPVAWLHDEIVLEIPAEAAKRAAELLEKAMVKAFAETFPHAPLNGLVEVHCGADWASLKG